MKKMLNSKQVNTRLPIHMVQQLKYVAQERNVTDGSIIEAALKDYLGKTEHEDVLMQKSDKLSRQIERLRRENGFMLEVMSSFIRVYLTHAQEIPEHEQHNSELKGAKKFSRFMDLVSKSLEQNKPFFDELEQRRFEKDDFTQ